MVVIRNKNPIDITFVSWISQFPESYHPSDEERFYVFVKTVCRDSRQQRDSSWLRKKITNYRKHHLEQLDIENYCDLFDKLIDFYKVKPLALYERRKA